MATQEGRNRSGASPRAYTRRVDVFTLLVAVLLLGALWLGLRSKRSVLEILDWKPTRSPEAEAANEVDDLEQMLAAQNELRRRHGKPERTLEDVWRES